MNVKLKQARNHAGEMIGRTGNVDGNIRKLPHMIRSGKRIGQNYLEKTVMAGGGFIIKVKTRTTKGMKMPIAGDISEHECPKCEEKLIWALYSEDYYGNTGTGLQCENDDCEFDEIQPSDMESFLGYDD